MLNPFEGDAWSQATLTDGINRNPTIPRQISGLGWAEKGVTTIAAIIDQKDGQLAVVDSAPYNGVPTQLTLREGEPIAIAIPSHPAESVLWATEVSARRAFGTENDTETVEARSLEHYGIHNNAHALTEEIDRIGALQGLTLRPNGLVKTNLAAQFGRSPLVREANFADTQNFNIVSFLLDLVNEQGEKANGGFIEGWDWTVDATTWKALINNKFIRDNWKTWQSTMLTADMRRRGFEIVEGVFVKQYMNNHFIPGTDRKIFPVGGILVPRIAGNLQTLFAPRQDFDYVNTVGLPAYMIPTTRKKNEALDLYSEANRLHYVRQPELNTLTKQAA